MNKTYALVWNGAQRCWSAVGETARRRGKASGGKRAAITAVSLLGFTALPAFALPSGEAILSGKADILRTEDGRTMNINQHTDKLITNWQDFSVGGGERVSFHQPDSQSLALNRVIGTNGSRIDGQISANGRVFLVNPNGVLFGSGAQVNVGGLVASTQNLSDADFLAGNYRFSGSSTQSVTNDGTITAADGGSVALLGARVANNGVIQAKMGRVALGAGNAFTVNFDGSGLLNLQVNGGAVDAQASNGGLLKADGGEVLMTARAAGNLLDAVVNHTGTIEARGLNARGGKITLDGGTVKVGGKLDASAADAGAPTGSILTRGERVDVANDTQVDTRAGHTAGTWTIEAVNASVGDTAGASNARGFNNNSNITGNEGVGHGGGGSSTSNASIAADTLSRNLGTTNVALTNTKHDLAVGGPVSWASDNTLTLTSATGNVNLRKSLSASGNDARLLVNAANRIDIDDAVTLTGRNAHLELNSKAGHALSKQAVVTLSGRNASYRSNGDDYTVLHTLDDLRNVDANLGGRYILGNAIDGNHASFRSIGGTRFFNGKFDGLGNTISRLNITNPGFNAVGLFAANTGWIGNLRLDSLVANTTGARYAAALGGLVGMNVGGQIRNVDATNITVSGNGSASGTVGGLVGRNLRGTIENVRFAGKVSGRTDSLSVGGLVGRNDDGTLRNVSSNATVSAGIGGYVGGLVGYNSGTIENATASGNVTAEKYATVGGLVGTNAAGGVIRNVSTDNTLVASESFIGGIAGENEKGGLIENASSSATIGGRDAKGGLVAINRGTLRASHSRVTLSGSPTDFGGLVWFNEGVIESSSASGPAANYPAVKVNIGKVDDKTAMLSVK